MFIFIYNTSCQYIKWFIKKKYSSNYHNFINYFSAESDLNNRFRHVYRRTPSHTVQVKTKHNEAIILHPTMCTNDLKYFH